MKPAVVGPLNVCTVAGCTRASVSRVLRGGAGVVLCASHVAEQCIGSSVKKAALSDWSAEGRCVGRWSPVTTDECWLLSSGHRACGTCAADIKDELLRVESEPTLRCLGCAELLQRPLHFGLDGQARCPACSRQLVSAVTIARRMVAPLVLLWLRSCSQLMHRFVGTARGAETGLGCRLVHASLLARAAQCSEADS